MRALDVWLYGRRAGRLEQDGGQLRFGYADDYRADGGPPLSCSLPTAGAPSATSAPASGAGYSQRSQCSGWPSQPSC